MLRLRRYLRGSGRVLAFVFAASVVWLLLDMAALRLSINDVNSQVLRDRTLRDRAPPAERRPRVTQLVRGGFKHPLQRVHVAPSPAGGGLDSGARAAEVYRLRRERVEFGGKERRSGGHDTRSHSKDPPSERGGTTIQTTAPWKDVAVGNKAGGEDADGMRGGRGLGADGSERPRPPAVANVTKRVEENRELFLNTSKKESSKSGNVVANAPEGSEDKPTRGAGGGRLEPVGTRPAQTSSQPPNEDLHTKANTKTGEAAAKSDARPAEDAGTPTVATETGSRPNPAAVGKAGVHKVRSLDATLVPRDAKAVGQFGQAVLVSSRDDAQVKKRWDEGFFNVYLSDQIPVDRAIPDTRPET